LQTFHEDVEFSVCASAMLATLRIRQVKHGWQLRTGDDRRLNFVPAIKIAGRHKRYESGDCKNSCSCRV
jgi:hypothetical protein